jgi:hypothetical protein
VEGEDSTAEEEDSTAEGAEDFMEVAEERSAEVEVSTAEVALGSAAEASATSEVAAVSAGAEEIGAEDSVTDEDGDLDLALGGRIGVGDGDIRMVTTTRGITGPIPIILTRTTVLRTIPQGIRILTTGTTILHRQIPGCGPNPTRTDQQDPGDLRYQEAERMQITETATSLPLRRAVLLSPLTA